APIFIDHEFGAWEANLPLMLFYFSRPTPFDTRVGSSGTGSK
ncbi:MAG: hypothetical protein ACI9FZ_001133, partial [Bacteroidia bacterium]